MTSYQPTFEQYKEALVQGVPFDQLMRVISTGRLAQVQRNEKEKTDVLLEEMKIPVSVTGKGPPSSKSAQAGSQAQSGQKSGSAEKKA